MIKYFCDVCEVEVPDPSFSLDMTGKVLCGKHLAEHHKRNKNTKWVYKHTWDKKPANKGFPTWRFPKK